MLFYSKKDGMVEWSFYLDGLEMMYKGEFLWKLQVFDGWDCCLFAKHVEH
jgi:hypothetical protein